MSISTGLEAPPAVGITEADVAGFAAKLEAWYETLPPAEQAVLQRLLACVEGTASEECEVEGYALTGIGARLARLFAAGLMTATLAAPLAASTLPSSILPVNPVTAQLTQTPEQIIQAKARALGADFTGSPIVSPSSPSGLETVPNGFRIRYQKCDIYYSPATGAHEVHGDIRAKYGLMFGPRGRLGLPRTDELALSDGVGRYNEFSGDASIVWSPHTGPFALEGLIRRAWINQGAEHSRFGYPTSGLQSQGAGQWTDFQNDVLYLEGTHSRAIETAELTRAQLRRALVNVLGGDAVFNSTTSLVVDDFSILGVTNTGDDFSLLGVSDTGQDLSHSRNRLINVRIQGHFTDHLPFQADPSFRLDLSLLFFAQKEADGSTSLRVALDDHHLALSGLAIGLNAAVHSTFLDPFASPVKLINVSIPAAVPVLSFKVLEDGALKLFLQPGGGAPLVQLAVQLAFDRLAK